MTRKELLEKVSKNVGFALHWTSLVHATSRGHVPPAEKGPDGWYMYGDAHARALEKYARARSHRRRRAGKVA